ncbi:MAG: MFS transporter [Candidatus Methylacidiphilales bacterium]
MDLKPEMRGAAVRNIPCFIGFRICFNARFYYPVFAIFFIDHGLTMGQFALLNVVWAMVIVLAEVPFGALADRIGRRPLVVAAGVVMVLEMAVLMAAPVGNPALAFWFFLLNRILSGVAEALASGADEALAYDSLTEEGRETRWAGVMKQMMSWQSAAFFVAMLTGGVVYDAGFLNRIFEWAGTGWVLDSTQTLKIPVVLTLITSVAGVVLAWMMQEPARHVERMEGEVVDSWSQVRRTCLWVMGHRAVLALILMGLLFDSTVRMMITLGSEYFRFIQYPEAAFGVLGALSASLGFISGSLGKWLVGNRGRGVNFLVLGAVGAFGLTGVALGLPYVGYVFWMVLMIGFGLLNFFISTYLNAETPSEVRATVLSVRSMIFNMGYGVVGLLYAGWTYGLRGDGDGEGVFAASLTAFPVYFVLTYFVAWWWLRRGLGWGVTPAEDLRS